MSRALAVFHGHFGRATVYQLNRPFNVHAHREGHLIFHIGGTPGSIEVLEQPHLLCEDTVVAVNPWEPHNFLPKDVANGALFLVLYVNADWFAGVRGLRFGCTKFNRTVTLDRNIRAAAAMVCGARSLKGLAGGPRRAVRRKYLGGGAIVVRRALAKGSRGRPARRDRPLPRRELVPGGRLAGR